MLQLSLPGVDKMLRASCLVGETHMLDAVVEHGDTRSPLAAAACLQMLALDRAIGLLSSKENLRVFGTGEVSVSEKGSEAWNCPW